LLYISITYQISSRRLARASKPARVASLSYVCQRFQAEIVEKAFVFGLKMAQRSMLAVWCGRALAPTYM
jgi:hypothetical protein